MRTGCDAVRLRRGGYYPPGCFPMGKTTSAHCADNAISNICRWNLTVQCRNMVYMQHWNLDTAKLVLPKNLQRWRADDIRPYTVCATEISPRSFGGTVCVGAAISRPVVFPWGKQRRRKAPTMAPTIHDPEKPPALGGFFHPKTRYPGNFPPNPCHTIFDNPPSP